MSNLWLGLLANTAIVALVISLWSNVHLPKLNRPGSSHKWELGALLGLGAIGVMLIPFQLSEGFFIDLRMTMIGTAAFVGGPVAGIITTLVAAAFRIYLGGAGVLIGLAGIFLACGVGLLAHRLKGGEIPTLMESIIFSLALAVSSSTKITSLPFSKMPSFPAL